MTHLDDSTSTDRLLQLSLYVQAGMRLLPIYEVLADGSCACGKSTCTAVGKHPRVDGWQYVATTREETLRLWNETWPTCNWAWAIDEDQYVVDCDPRNGGPRTEALMDDWASYGFTIPVTRFAFSGGGGVHIICKCDEDNRPNGNDSVMVNGTAIPGVNVKGHGGYVLVAPSNHVSGGFYSWHDTPMTPLAEWPAVIEQLKSRTRQRQRTQGSNGQRESHVPVGSWDHRNEHGRVNIDAWLANASEVPSGEQHNYLVSGLGWLAVRGRSEGEMKTMAWTVASSFINYDEANPWTRAQVEWLATDARERWPAEVPGNTVIPSWRGGPTGTPSPGPDEPLGVAAEDVGATLQDAMADERQRPTDMANATIFSRRFGHEMLWTPQTGWHVYDGRIWGEDVLKQRVAKVKLMAEELWAAQIEVADEDERQVLTTRSNRLESSSGIKAAIDLSEHMLAADESVLDQQGSLLAVENGVVDLKTGELRPFNPAYLVTRFAPTRYVPGARSDLLDDYLDTFVPYERREVIFRVLGGCLIGGNSWRSLVIMHGPTTTGKSQLAQMIQLTLGAYARSGTVSIFRGNLDDSPRPDVVSVLQSRMAIMEEAGAAWELHADKVKEMTGGTTISVRKMRSDHFIQRVPSFTPVVVTNEMPRVKGADDAVRRRLVILPFTKRPQNEDALRRQLFLDDQPTREAVLSELVAGCLRAQQHGAGADHLPLEFQMLRDQAFSELDDVAMVLGHLVESGVLRYVEGLPITHSVTSAGLHKAYRQFHKVHGNLREALDLIPFGLRLSKLPQYETKRTGGIRRVLGWVITDPTYAFGDGAGQLPGSI